MTGEAKIHFIWKHRLFGENPLRTTCGQELEILDPGETNLHAGPDFFNARIKLDNIIWAGNVEVHRQASHWYRHGHHLNPAYDNVILHVIHICDVEIKNSKGRPIPSLVIAPRLFEISLLHFQSLKETSCLCQQQMSDIKEEVLRLRFKRICAERLNQKTLQFTQLLDRYPHSKEKALFIAMASGFGLPINRLPFEMVANGIPLSLLEEVKESLPDLEAILFGQSGLLQVTGNKSTYVRSLRQRYAVLKKAIPLHPLPDHVWKFLRIRPASFPTLRLSQFASFINLHYPFYEKFTQYDSAVEAGKSFDVKSSPFWNTHYTFTNSSNYIVKKLGRQAILNLTVNVLIPFMAASQKTDPACRLSTAPIRILDKLDAESNFIIKKWSSFGIEPNNALESQALIQLYKVYCKQKRCNDCQIVAELTKVAIHE